MIAFITTIFFTWMNIIIFRCADPETQDYYYYFADQPTQNNSPGRLCNKELSCLKPKTVVILKIQATRFTSSQSDFSVKVNDQTNRGRQIDKITADTGRDTRTTFTDFTGRYEVALKEGHRQNQKTHLLKETFII